MVLDVVQFILGLGPTVMLPIVITIIGMAFGQGLKKHFVRGLRSGSVLSALIWLLDYLLQILATPLTKW